MKFNPDFHHRRSIRLKNHDYSSPGAYFFTICTYIREPTLGRIESGEIVRNEWGKIVQETWNDLPTHIGGIELGDFVVMPNHVHGIVFIVFPGAGSPTRPLEEEVDTCNPHSCRHAVGKLIMEKTGNVAAVQRQLGHRNAQYSLQYARITRKELDQVLEKI